MRSEAGLKKSLGKRVLSGPCGKQVMIKLCATFSLSVIFVLFCRYKAKAAYEGILEYLDGCHREQVQSGIEDQEVNYPY